MLWALGANRTASTLATPTVSVYFRAYEGPGEQKMRLSLGFLLVCFLPLRCCILVAAPKERKKAEKRRANELESTIPVIQLCVADPELRQGQYSHYSLMCHSLVEHALQVNGT